MCWVKHSTTSRNPINSCRTPAWREDWTISLSALRGDHQLFNAALAVCVVELLKQRGFPIEEKAIRDGLATVRWPGRLEVIPGDEVRPSIVLDGAHNPDGAESLAAFLQSHFQTGKRILVFGVMKDKDFPEMLSRLVPVVDRVVLARPEIDRAADPADLAALCAGCRRCRFRSRRNNRKR